MAVSTDDNAKYGVASLSSGGTAATLTSDNHATGLGGFAGYQANRYLGLEAGFTYLGNYVLTGTFSNGSAPRPGNERDVVSAFYAAGVGHVPIGDDFYLLGKLGATYTTDAESCSATFACYDYTTRNMGLMFGFGLGIRGRFSRPVHFNLEYDQFNNVGDSNQYTSGNFRYINVSAVLLF